MAKKCRYCQYSNRDNARFCAGCGSSLSEPLSTTKTYVALQSGQTMRGDTYRVVKPLGKGGMGAVYLVEDTGAFGRHRVIKEMLQYFNPMDQQAVQSAQERFEAEGRTLARLRYPGIPDITAYFTENGRNYIVMEYVEGSDLLQGLTHTDVQGNLVQGKPYPIEDVLRWGIQLCDVLIYLAQQQPPVVHHDIKPANIIIDRNTGEARLVDFGTAKARLVAQPGGGVGLQQSSIYGTAGYAAPEMYSAESSPLSDVHSLAATLYHLLTDDDPGAHPFIFPELDRLDSALQAALQGALQRDPQQRSDAHTFRQALQDVQAALHGEIDAPFTFPDGQQARTPRELARLCDAQWNIARKLLYNGDFEHWLRFSLFRADLADKAAEIVRTCEDEDEGLEELLHIINSRLAHPKLRLRPRTLRFGRISPGAEVQRTVRMQNRARRGPLKGIITTETPALWLDFPDHFDGDGDILVTVVTKDVPYGTQLATRLEFETAYEKKSVTVRGQVAFPWLQALGKIGMALLVGGLVGRYLSFLSTNNPEAMQTYIGIGIAALLLAGWLVYRAQALWKEKAALLVFYTLLFGTVLILLNRLCYSSWNLVGQFYTVGSWEVPMGVGVIAGVTIGTIRALSRPGHRLVPWLFACLILMGCLSHCEWTYYQATGQSVAILTTSLPEQTPTTATSRPPTITFTRPRPTWTTQPLQTARPSKEGIIIGTQVIVVTDGKQLNVRQEPVTNAPIVARVNPATRLEVLNGPQTANGYTWWHVQLPDGTMGWAAEDWLKPTD